ncbi:MAG TPA: ATP-binding protein [Leptospiraceae bacterium]|nr:ATP-binding protein [Leptospiraceae bacterium]HMW08296.1 ATP-binding protein [Leptospiraceae bacterium]HMX33133.1 ATP-binding protein [Leptospiraceae bacterium]HMY34014.1 ATP-binding protein [Leptospiraceae bacterium]HMZ63082.1 ATP-binding protein [Leptospiraceae bacterium]
MSNDSSNLLILQLKADWSELDRVSDSIQTFFANSDLTKDDLDAVKMVTTELVENGIKYGYYPNPETTLELILRKKKKRIVMEVKNQVKDSELVHLRRLDAKIQWIRGYQNPFEAYVERLKEISNKNLAEGESGLGLVRIAYEGQSILDFYVNEDNLLAVSAVYQY